MTDDEYVEAIREAVYGSPRPAIGCLIGTRTTTGEVRMINMTNARAVGEGI